MCQIFQNFLTKLDKTRMRTQILRMFPSNPADLVTHVGEWEIRSVSGRTGMYAIASNQHLRLFENNWQGMCERHNGQMELQSEINKIYLWCLIS